MTSRLPFRLSHLICAGVLSCILPATMLAGPGSGGSGSGGQHGGGGGHSGGHASGHAGGSTGNSAGGRMAGSIAPTSHGGVPYGNPGGPSGGNHSDAAVPAGHYSDAGSYQPGAQRDAGTEANLSRMAGHGWHFLPSAGVRPAVVPTRTPASGTIATRLASHPALFPPYPRGRGPYATSIYPFGAFFGPGFGFGGNCGFNGFTSFCGPLNGLGYYAPPCFRHFYPGCGPWGLGWSPWAWGLGWGWGGGYYGYGLYDASGYAPYDSTPPVEDDSSNVQGMNNNVEAYADAPLDVPPVAEADVPGGASAAAGQGVSPASAAPAQLIFKNGTAYAVKAYWVANGELYYRPVYGGVNHVPLEQLDLRATVEANSRAGVPFTLATAPPQE